MKRVRSLIRQYLEYEAGCGHKPNTIRSSGYSLGRFARWVGEVDIREVESKTIKVYIDYLKGVITYRKKPMSAGSIQTELVRLNGFFGYLYRNESILVNPFEDIELKLVGRKVRKVFNREDIEKFLDSIPVGGAEEQRDRAIFELMYSSGLRVGEVMEIELEDVDLEDRVLVVEGKGGKGRTGMCRFQR